MSRGSPGPSWASLLLLAGCGPGFLAGSHPQVVLAPPTIASFRWDCDLDAGTWTLTAEATSWTGGGEAVITRDLTYVELHDVRATESAPDGSAETLQLVLSIVSDWRAQASGRSTVFTCGQDPTVAFTLLDTSGEPVDCVVEGPVAERLAKRPEVQCGPATPTDTGASAETGDTAAR
ncbi:MAG: hypothetical protein R3F59_21140 [Myxococcota bacterium]